MRFYTKRNMLVCKSVTMHRLWGSRRWLTYAVFMTLVMRAAAGLLENELLEAPIVECDNIMLITPLC